MSDKTNKMILIVEDDSGFAEILQAQLERLGYRIVTSKSGEAAIELLASGLKIDLVLMDIELGGGLNGIQTADLINQSYHFPFVFMSGFTNAEFVKKTRAVTSYGYIVKGTDITVIDTLIQTACKLFETNRQLSASEEKFRKAFTTSPDSVNINRLNDGLYIDINDGFTKLTGFTREDVIGKSSSEINIWVNPKDRDRLVDGLQKNGSVTNLEAKFRRKDGTITVALMSAQIISIKNVPHILSITRDIADRKQSENTLFHINEQLEASVEQLKASEEKLVENEENLRITLDAISEGVIATDIKGLITRMNPAAESITGWQQNKVVHKPLTDVFKIYDPETRKLLDSPIEKIVKSGQVERDSNYGILVKENGDELYIQNYAAPIWYRERKLVGVVISFRNVTEMVEKNRQIQKSEKELELINERFELAAKAANIGVWDYDIINQYLEWDSRMFRIFQVDKETFKHSIKDWEKTLHPDDHDTAMESVYDALNNKGRLNFECRIILPDHRVRYIKSEGTTICDENGKPVRMLGVNYDITESVHSNRALEAANEQLKENYEKIRSKEAALINSEKRYRKLFEQMLDAFALHEIVLDDNNQPVDYRFLEVNRAFEDMTGLKRSNIIGKCVTEVLPGTEKEDADWIGTYGKVALSGEPITFEQFSAAIEKWFMVRAFSPRKGQFATIFMDISDNKKAEQEKQKFKAQLRRSQKLETIGLLASGIAHDFNNLLTPIIGYSQIARYSGYDREEVDLAFENIQKAAYRASDIVKQVLTFSREHEQALKPLDIRIIIKETLHLLRVSIPSSIKIETSLSTNPLYVNADASQIHQVMMNLCTNSFQAMEKTGGELSIVVTRDHADENQKCLSQKFKSEDCALIKVSDTGSGIKASDLENIFDPFFTTKNEQNGTGLGLSVVHGIIKTHGGEINIESEYNKGTTVSIYLPLLDKKKRETISMTTDIPTGDETILIVDDDLNVLRTISKILNVSGYKTITETISHKAVQRFKKDNREIDLVITDLTMPEINGLELAKKIKQIDPSVPIALISGYAQSVTPEVLDQNGIARMLTKPVVHREIATAVRHILDEKGK